MLSHIQVFRVGLLQSKSGRSGGILADRGAVDIAGGGKIRLGKNIGETFQNLLLQ